MALKNLETNARKVAVITGASSGIGYITARELAQMGFHVIALGRNPARSGEKIEELRRSVPGAMVDLILADLTSLVETRRAAAEIADLVARVDVLINNAGDIVRTRQISAEGLEKTFAGNYLAPFLLTNLLLPLLRAAPAARIVNVSSIGHTMIPDMVWDDLQFEHGYDPNQAYYQSKLAIVLFTRELARRLAPEGIVANAVHPGVVYSPFRFRGGEHMSSYYDQMNAAGETVTEEEGADTLIWLASAPQSAAETGGYFVNRLLTQPAPAAQNDESARRLWAESVKMLESTIGHVTEFVSV